MLSQIASALTAYIFGNAERRPRTYVERLTPHAGINGSPSFWSCLQIMWIHILCWLAFLHWTCLGLSLSSPIIPLDGNPSQLELTLNNEASTLK